MSETRDASLRSSKQQPGPHSEQPIEDIPMPDTTSISDSGDTGSAHLSHIKPRPEWLKPIPKGDRPATSEPALEFVQAMQTFLTDKANLDSPTKKGRKDKLHVIPYCRFTKLIICHLGRIHNIHQRSASLFHLAEEDLRLGNLKFISKGEVDEVFGMPIPNELISNSIRNAPYYNVYLEMVAKHDQKAAAEMEGKKKTASVKQPKPKPTKEKPSMPSTAKPSKPKPAKENSFQLVDELDEEPAQPEPKPEHQGKGEEYDVERAIQMSLESFHVVAHAHVGGVAIRKPVVEAARPLSVVEGKGKGKAIATKEQVAQSLLALHAPKRRSTTDQFIFQRRTLATEEASTGPSTQPQDDTSANIVHDSPSSADAETGEYVDKQVNLEEKTIELDQDQDGSDPGETHESRPPPEQVFMDEDQAGPDPRESDVALIGPNPEPTHDEFMANLYPKVQESLKFSANKHVILEDPLSSIGTLSSMNNLEDAYTIGDQFFNDKSTEDECHYPHQSRVFTLELRDLPHKIDGTICETVKEVVQVALQAPLRDRFRDLSEEDMKEILHQRIFESGTYKSLPEHVSLYEALKASMAQAQRDEFLAEKDKSCKRHHDDQDPPPPLLDSDLSKKK
ncbi:hypothetical protein Tco_0089899 [Tanacetum coccineum]